MSDTGPVKRYWVPRGFLAYVPPGNGSRAQEVYLAADIEPVLTAINPILHDYIATINLMLKHCNKEQTEVALKQLAEAQRLLERREE